MTAGTKMMRIHQRTMRGVTLLELMIVVVIIGILAAIAYPNYRTYIERAKRPEAISALLQIATNQEKRYIQSHVFTTDLTDLGLGTNPLTFTTGSGAYVITVATAVPSADFTATATYQLGGNEAGKCLTFTIDESGVRASAPEADCWTRTQ